MMTYEDSVALAKTLKELGQSIHTIELFGSVLTKGQGRDADFAVLVADDVAKHWWSNGRGSIRVRWPDALYGQRWVIKKFAPFIYAATVHRRRRTRLEFSAHTVGINLKDLADPAGTIPDFELFLMPVGWRTGTELNLDVMRGITDLVDDKNTLGFLKRIAKDAVAVA